MRISPFLCAYMRIICIFDRFRTHICLSPFEIPHICGNSHPKPIMSVYTSLWFATVDYAIRWFKIPCSSLRRLLTRCKRKQICKTCDSGGRVPPFHSSLGSFYFINWQVQIATIYNIVQVVTNRSNGQLHIIGTQFYQGHSRELQVPQLRLQLRGPGRQRRGPRDKLHVQICQMPCLPQEISR